MSSNEMVPEDRNESAVTALTRRRRADNQDDMPPALLEFHSPSAAMASLPPTPSARYVTWIISSMAIASVLTMALFPLSEVVTAGGALVPTVPTIVVQPLATSIIRSIDVHEGEIVHKGQILAHLDPTSTDADYNNLRDQVSSLTAEVNRLTATVEGKDYVAVPNDPASTQQAAIFLRRRSEFNSKLSNYNQQIAGLQSDLVGYQANAAMYAGRVKVAADVNNMRQQLEKAQVGSRLNSLASQDELMEMERSQISAQQNAAAARAKLNAMIAERDGYVQSTKADDYQALTEAQRKLYEANGSFTKATQLRNLLVMRADRDAVVLNIAHLSVGSVISAAQQFMTLTPLDAPLEVEARLPSNQAGYVKVGDLAQIKFQTFSYVQYGGADAHVVNISADSFSPDQAQAATASAPANGLATPGGGKESFYRVRLVVDRYTLHGVPPFFKPTPGMGVSADINVGKRTILQYLLATVVPTLTEGMRDPS
ncbi:HlyD family type I secretion periplasmic adaptor subunit [Acetobacteraceae bacterium KSS8]|uniref:Membrane fusion protein (MFP) family protein n=1 Tax=Endosaccharibacter trunci TaxID=2812733 RepID=A0ABT1W5J6_9PROT|nr:HlyD family type I secretion periplasmic adaptor subunit [Acetobacteraceae bacterium KSS8]